MADRKKNAEEILDGTEYLRRKVSGLSRLKDAGITGSQWLLVRHVFQNEGCTVNDAAAALNMTGSAVTQLANGLVAKGYLIRRQDREDRRAHRLMLSAKSTKRISEFKRQRVGTMLKVFAVLSDREFAQYAALNKKLVQAALSKKHD